MGLTNLLLAATYDPKTRLTSQWEHAHIRPSPKSSPADVGYYMFYTRIYIVNELVNWFTLLRRFDPNFLDMRNNIKSVVIV